MTTNERYQKGSFVSLQRHRNDQFYHDVLRNDFAAAANNEATSNIRRKGGRGTQQLSQFVFLYTSFLSRMSGSSSSSSSSHAFVTTVCTIAAAAAVSLSVLQTDTVSRRVLSSQKLQRKRVHEYQYRWDWTLKKFLLRYARKGHDQQMDKANTEVFFQDEDIQGFIETKLLNEGNISIMSIEVDDDTLEYYIFFVNNTNQHMYQLPLAKFSVHLNNVMQDRLTSTTLCFIADASSGLSGSLLSTVLRESKAGVVCLFYVHSHALLP